MSETIIQVNEEFSFEKLPVKIDMICIEKACLDCKETIYEQTPKLLFHECQGKNYINTLYDQESRGEYCLYCGSTKTQPIFSQAVFCIDG